MAALLVVGAALLVWALVAAIAGGGGQRPGPTGSPEQSPPASPSSAPGVTIPPSIIGMNGHDAKDALRQLGLDVHVRKVKSKSDQPDDVVLDSNPAPGTVVSPRTPVTLYVSDSGHGPKHDKGGPD